MADRGSQDFTADELNAGLAASPMLVRFYLAGGGSTNDLRTDLSDAVAAIARHRAATLGGDVTPA